MFKVGDKVKSLVDDPSNQITKDKVYTVLEQGYCDLSWIRIVTDKGYKSRVPAYRFELVQEEPELAGLQPDAIYVDKLATQEEDPISHPSHYTQGFAIEPIEFVMANNLGFCEGNVIKYICRYNKKGTPKQDLEKAKQYIQFLLDVLGEEVK